MTTSFTTPGGIGITVVFDGLTLDEGIDVRIRVWGAVAINGEVLALENGTYVEGLLEAGLNSEYDGFGGTVFDDLV